MMHIKNNYMINYCAIMNFHNHKPNNLSLGKFPNFRKWSEKGDFSAEN